VVNVFITVDTEIWPAAPLWPHTPLGHDYDASREIDAYFHGRHGGECWGIPFQLDALAAHGLKATYFVDPLFSYALGLGPLRDVVAMIAGREQEVALHLHPEWLTDPRCAGLPAFRGPLLHAYSGDEQRALVRAGLHRLADAGATSPVVAFRAGNWSAGRNTLEALAAAGIRYDSSLNARFDASFPDFDAATSRSHQHPFRVGEVWEFPVTSFVDQTPVGRRPMHVCAVSLAEMQMVLEHARDSGWHAVVIVLHSFEFVRVGRLPAGKDPAPYRLVARRFEGLCEYLANHSDDFATRHFADIDESAIPDAAPQAVPIASGVLTAMRHLQQLATRVY
jgi:hypothetical protein